MVLSPSMRRHLCRRRDGIVALILMVLLPPSMRRHLSVVDNDDDGVTGYNNNDDFDNTMDFLVITMVLLPLPR
jgi:hypothetical protein